MTLLPQSPSLKLVFVRLIALLLVVALWPGASELIEQTVHAVEHGDLAHDSGDEHDSTPLGQDEHGCSGTLHLCQCHQPAPVITASGAVVVASVDAEQATVVLAPVARIGVGVTAPPTRPPIV